MASYCLDVRRRHVGGDRTDLGPAGAEPFPERNTAGIGEHLSTLRGRVCCGLECLRLHLDAEKNQEQPADRDIAMTRSAGRILVIRTREQQMIALEAQRLLNQTN